MAAFQRTKFRAYVKLGKRQKKMRKYRRATGRHNKTRQKWKSHPVMVEIGYKNKAQERGLIRNKKPIIIYNLQDLNNAKAENIIIIGKIGMKNKIKILKEIEKRNLEVYNINVKKCLKENDKKLNPEEKEKNAKPK
jgi:ribosomal protein L32E